MLQSLSKLLVVLATLGSLQPTTTEVPLSSGGRLVFVHPSSWRARVGGPVQGPTLVLDPSGGAGFKVLVTALPRANGHPADQAELERVLRKNSSELLRQSVQTELSVVRVSGKQAEGLLYHLTDRSPEKGPGDYREMNQGAVIVGPYLLTFTILTHTDDSATVADAIEVVRTVSYRAAAR